MDSQINANEKMTSINKKIYLIAFGLFLLDLSLIFVNKAGELSLNSTLFSQLSISVIFGFFHGYKKFLILRNLQKSENVLDLIYLFFIYTAWYNVILLPISGFGVIEWLLVCLVLFSDFFCAISNKKDTRVSYISNSDLNLLIFGCILAIFKSVVFYLFPENIYIESFYGNKTARFIILFFCVVGLIFLISFMIKALKSNEILSENDSEHKVINKFLVFLKKAALKCLALLSGTTLLVVLATIGLAALVIIFGAGKMISNNILKFVEPYLIKLTSTGKNMVTPSHIYRLFQISVMAAVLIYDRACTFEKK